MTAQPTQPLAPPLWQLVERMRALLAEVDEADGEVTAEVAAQLDALAPTLERKVEAYAGVYRQLEGEASACAAMAEHYTRRKERLLRQREQLRQRLCDGMRKMGLRKIEAPTATAAIQKSPPKLVITDENAARDRYPRVTVDVDKQALRAAVDAGECDCAHLEQSEYLRIK